MWFRSMLLALVIVSFPGLAHAGAAAVAAKDAPVAAADDGWPDTHAGEVARGWVTAFDAGETAMRAFYEKTIAPESLKQRPVEARMENYAKLRERYGRLTLGTVVASKPAELTVTLLDADAATHTFVFTVQPKAPWKLVSVGIQQLQQVHGHGGFHH